VKGQGVIGRDCAWCGLPAVCEIEVQPAEYRTTSRRDPVNGERVTDRRLVRLAIVVAACDAHRDITIGQPRPVVSPRHCSTKRGAQLGLSASTDEQRMRNAIGGSATGDDRAVRGAAGRRRRAHDAPGLRAL
jgi:hypothetical protein